MEMQKPKGIGQKEAKLRSGTLDCREEKRKLNAITKVIKMQ